MSDDVDELLDGDRSRLEARFRELELQAEVDRLRREQGGSAAGSAASSTSAAGEGDPLAAMKAALGQADGGAPTHESATAERYVLALCPHCDAKNRISLTRLRTANPRCGGCKQPLSYT